jgi:hypothetical protein
MGASSFITAGTGKTAETAYRKLVSKMEKAYGNDGYNGTISTTSGFVDLTHIAPAFQSEADLYAWADDFLMDNNLCAKYRIDKFGKCGVIQTDKDEFTFFGWAAE